MEKLDLALDDLAGLLELYRALRDDARTSTLRRDVEGFRRLQREIAAAADAYAATLIASAAGEVTGPRITRCRKAALAKMKSAVAKQRELAALVNQKRLPAPTVQADVAQLVALSLQCRAAVAALAASPTVDNKAAEAIGNKVLVDLREATLLYLARARDSATSDGGAARVAVVALLERTGPHAAELARLQHDGAEAAEGAGNILAQDVNTMLHRTARDWDVGAEPPAA